MPEDESIQEQQPDEKRCTCGAQQFAGCFCGLTPQEFITAHPDRSVT